MIGQFVSIGQYLVKLFLDKIIIFFYFLISKGLQILLEKNKVENKVSQQIYYFKVIKILYNSFKNFFKLIFFSNVLWILCKLIILSSEVYINFLKPLCIFFFENIIDFVLLIVG